MSLIRFPVGSRVRVLPPFADCFPGVHLVTDVVLHDDGSIVYLLGDAGGFDAIYLEAAV